MVLLMGFCLFVAIVERYWLLGEIYQISPYEDVSEKFFSSDANI